jgi:hypothetical protein
VPYDGRGRSSRSPPDSRSQPLVECGSTASRTSAESTNIGSVSLPYISSTLSVEFPVLLQRPGLPGQGFDRLTHISHLSQAKTIRAIRADVSKFSVSRFLVTASDARIALLAPAQPPPTPPIPNVVSDSSKPEGPAIA